MKIGIIQQQNTNTIDVNIANLCDKIENLAKKGVELIVLQELHNSLYFCQTENPDLFDLAETIPGKSTQIFGDIACKYQVVLVLSLFERRAAVLW